MIESNKHNGQSALDAKLITNLIILLWVYSHQILLKISLNLCETMEVLIFLKLLKIIVTKAILINLLNNS